MINKEDLLFQQGVQAFNERKFYDAHDYWEELWLEYKLDDAKFIQGLIQLSVSYFHLFNQNLKGARSMIRKCLTKFEAFHSSRGIDIIQLKEQIKKVQIYLNKISLESEIKDTYIITLEVIHE